MSDFLEDWDNENNGQEFVDPYASWRSIISDFGHALISNDSDFIDSFFSDPEISPDLKLKLKEIEAEWIVMMAIVEVDSEKERGVLDDLDFEELPGFLERAGFWWERHVAPTIQLWEKYIKQLAALSADIDCLRLLGLLVLAIKQVLIPSNALRQYVLNLHTGPPGKKQLFKTQVALRRVLFASDIL